MLAKPSSRVFARSDIPMIWNVTQAYHSIVDEVVEVGHVDELQALDLTEHSALPWLVDAKVAVDDRGVAERPALIVGSRRRRRRRP